MKLKMHKPIIWMTLFILVVSLACKVVLTDPTATPTQEPTATTAPTPTEVPQPVGAAGNLESLEKAVIYIETAGSYREPPESLPANVGGSGSGFIIDPSGIAVTNSHVVPYESELKVWVYGEAEPRGAVVLGVSECLDLAVLDIDGDGFAYADWLGGDITAGAEVYAAGFPSGSRNYALNQGEVTQTGGSFNWQAASVDNVVEHTARVEPGFWGGPLADAEGKVLGVNFGSDQSQDKNYAVARDRAIEVIDQLRGGIDVDSLGINGVGVTGNLGDNPVAGVWVRSVKSGSPAEQTGIQPGDILTKLGDQALDDGTLAGYCSIVHAHSSTDVLDVSLVRSDNSEILEGQLNGTALAFVSTLTAGGGASELGNPNASKSGEVFFTSEFESADYWKTLRVPDSDQFDAYTDSGNLYLEIQPEGVTLYAFYDLVLNTPDVRVDTQAQKYAGPNTNNISLMCRATDAGWYEFSMTSGGYWRIWLYDKQKNTYTVLNNGATTAINMKNQPNLLTAVCSGDVLTFYINDVKVGSVQDSTFQGGGQVGVSIYAEYPGLGVVFEWFKAVVP